MRVFNKNNIVLQLVDCVNICYFGYNSVVVGVMLNTSVILNYIIIENN